MKKWMIVLFLFLVSILAGYFFFIREHFLSTKDRVNYNFGREIEIAASKYQIDPNFLKAVCALETSGKKRGKRFEKSVYKSLLSVKNGKRKRLENITQKELAETSDEGLRNLATSWGPFQLMGYKCFQLGIQVKDIRGENAVEWGVRWISQTYGDYLRNKRYDDAFHIHNTGRPIPASRKTYTTDPRYIENGLNYMEAFSEDN